MCIIHAWTAQQSILCVWSALWELEQDGSHGVTRFSVTNSLDRCASFPPPNHPTPLPPNYQQSVSSERVWWAEEDQARWCSSREMETRGLSEQLLGPQHPRDKAVIWCEGCWVNGAGLGGDGPPSAVTPRLHRPPRGSASSLALSGGNARGRRRASVGKEGLHSLQASASHFDRGARKFRNRANLTDPKTVNGGVCKCLPRYPESMISSGYRD